MSRQTFFTVTFRTVMLGIASAAMVGTLRAQEARPDAGQQRTQATERSQQQEATTQREQQQQQRTQGLESPTTGQAGQVPSIPQQPLGVMGFFKHKLMLGNQAEIELSQLALQKAQSPEVKQFAQMMIRDHQQLNQQLQDLQIQEESSDRLSQRGSATGVQRAGFEQEQQRVATQPGQEQQRSATDSQSSAADQQRTRATAAQRSELASNPGSQIVPRELVEVTARACQMKLQKSKQLLQQHTGQDFDMGYLGIAIASHTATLAELQSLENIGSPQFQQVVAQSEKVTQEHLQQAQQLAERIQGREGGQRSSNSSDTNTRTNRAVPQN